ncbi:hypothetical protein [Paenibacillus medicaginis]|uniref:Uncharacterized protein n=1 Tax=Paenibacillus medicaginis TaxID=1470560 RepID=A0ABV5C2H2_9BACL
MRVQVISDLYNGIFAVQQSHPDLYVDYSIWNRINIGLPEQYILPDQRILTVLLEGPK